MKKTFAFILVISLVFRFVGCGAKESKKDIFSLVENNYDTILKACEEKDKDALLAINGITDVNIVDGYVIIYCKGAGIAPSSQDYGFYYTKENVPVGIGCNLDIVCYIDTMKPVNNGFEGTVDHNTFYTERIQGNIYFYSNAY